MERRPVALLSSALAVLLCAFTIAEVNYPRLGPQSQLAVFATLALVLCFLNQPAHPRLRAHRGLRVLDASLAALSVLCGGFIVVQTEPAFRGLWIDGTALGNRAGLEGPLDVAVGIVGLLLILEATRRTIGWALPLLSLLFLGYAYWGAWLPDLLFPHRGYGLERIVAQSYLHSQGVFGTALNVMFTYVFLFVVFGAVLQETGATAYVIDFARRIFGADGGAPAKIAVLSSGMLGSVSGSAVANTATTGTFTIPMMRSAGLRPEIAAGIEAAASSGGALVPPVMGAGAYMMLEIVDPPVTYLQIVKAALIPSILYYLSLLLTVHFYAKRAGARSIVDERAAPGALLRYEALVFFGGLATLVLLLLRGLTVVRAVSLALAFLVLSSALHPRTRLGVGALLRAIGRAGRDTVPLATAAACVGVVLGVVTLTGIGTKLPAAILSLSEGNLAGALVLIMVSSIVLGMGLPSAVCYLLLATLIGSSLGGLGVVPLSAHLFIFYFGMMSMVTPPVALAGYTAASIAGAGILRSSLAAFRFALVGFTLPYMFVFRPELLLLGRDGGPAAWGDVMLATGVAVLGLVPLAAGIAGRLIHDLSPALRGLAIAAAILLLFPSPAADVAGVLLFAALLFLDARGGNRAAVSGPRTRRARRNPPGSRSSG